MPAEVPQPSDDQQPDENARPGRVKRSREEDDKAIEVSRHYLDLVEMLRRVNVTPEEFTELYKQATEDVEKSRPDEDE